MSHLCRGQGIITAPVDQGPGAAPVLTEGTVPCLGTPELTGTELGHPSLPWQQQCGVDSPAQGTPAGEHNSSARGSAQPQNL